MNNTLDSGALTKDIMYSRNTLNRRIVREITNKSYNDWEEIAYVSSSHTEHKTKIYPDI
jgi:hypothetical protein